MWADEKQNHLKNHDTGLITFLSPYQMSHWNVTEISGLQIVSFWKTTYTHFLIRSAMQNCSFPVPFSSFTP